MAVSFALKPAVKKVEQHNVSVQPSEQEQLIDELVSLDAQLKAFGVDKKQKRIAEIKKELQLIASQYDLGAPVNFVGQLGTVVLSKCASSTTITDPVALLGYLKEKFPEAWFTVIDFPLTKLKKLLSESELEKFTAIVYGARTTKIESEKE